MFKLIKGIFFSDDVSVILIILLIVVLAALMPLVLLWVINSLAKSGGSDFYLEYSLFNWFLALLLSFYLTS